MDTPLFISDWQQLEDDCLRAVQQFYSQPYADFLIQAMRHIEEDSHDIESIIASLDILEDLDLQICARILGVLLEIFSTLQHVHKTRSFTTHHFAPTDLKSNEPFELELFVTIHPHETMSLTAQNIFNRWFKTLAKHRHVKDTPLTETIRKQFIKDCITLFEQESFMQTLSLQEAFEHTSHQYLVQTLSGRIHLEERLLAPHLYHQIKIGFVIAVDHKDFSTVSVLQKLPAFAFECAWPILTKKYPVVLSFKETIRSAMTDRSPDEWKQLPEQSPSFAKALEIYDSSPMVLSMTAESLFSALDNIVQHAFQKRLRTVLKEESDMSSLSKVIREKMHNMRMQLLPMTRHILEVLDYIRLAPNNVLTDIIISDLNDAAQLEAAEILITQVFGLSLRLIPSFENPKSIADSVAILTAYTERLNNTTKPFLIKKALVGTQQHTKDKSFWWTHTQLYHVQDDLLQWAKAKGYALQIIQSRGGSLARGSLPTRCLINSTIFQSNKTYLGLVIHPDAFRQRLYNALTTEMTLWRYTKELLLAKDHVSIAPDLREMQQSLAQHSLHEVTYYVQEQPDLIDYFYSVTPAENLSPFSQHTLKNHKIEEINSTVWFGSWSQSRLLLPFWLGFGSVLLQWDRSDADLKKQLLADRCIEALFLVTLISLYRVNISIAKAYEKELLSHHLEEVGEHLQQRYQKVMTLTEKFLDFYEEDTYVKNFKDDMLYRNRYLTVLHAIQVQMLRRSRTQWPEQAFWRTFIRESMMFIGLGLQNSV